MSDCIFEKIEKDFPELLRTRDLIAIGIYSAACVAWTARKNNKGPAYVRLDGKIVYPKAGVIEFLQKKLMKSSAEEEVGHVNSASIST